MEQSSHILITGGAGFIGGHLAERLIAGGNRVTIVDNADMSQSCLQKLGLTNHPSVQCIRGSVTKDNVWQNLPTTIEYIVHAAAVLGIDRVAQEPLETLDATVIGTRRCLAFATQLPSLKRFLYLSTSEIYGVSANTLSEREPASIQTEGERWCYASAKLAAEFYVKAFSKSFGLPFSIVRPFNVYGPYRASANAMTNFAKCAVANQALHVSGTGLQTRSWCYIADFIDGLMRCLFFEAAIGQIFNLGNDEQNISVLKLAEFVRSVAQSSSEIVVGGTFTADVQERHPDLRKAKSLLGFNPRLSLLDGIAEVVAWARSARVDDYNRVMGPG